MRPSLAPTDTPALDSLLSDEEGHQMQVSQDVAAAARDAVVRRPPLTVRYEPETSAAGLTSFSPPLNPAQKNSSTAKEAMAGTIQMESQL